MVPSSQKFKLTEVEHGFDDQEYRRKANDAYENWKKSIHLHLIIDGFHLSFDFFGG